MLALDVGQHQRACDAVEHVGRGAPPRPCSSQVYQVGADVGALRHLLAAQARRAPAAPEKPNAAGSSLVRRSFR